MSEPHSRFLEQFTEFHRSCTASLADTLSRRTHCHLLRVLTLIDAAPSGVVKTCGATSVHPAGINQLSDSMCGSTLVPGEDGVCEATVIPHSSPGFDGTTLVITGGVQEEHVSRG